MSLIDDKIATELHKLDKAVCQIYDLSKAKSTPELMTEFDKLDDVLFKRLEKRPITNSEVTAAVMDYRNQFQKLCMKKK